MKKYTGEIKNSREQELRDVCEITGNGASYRITGPCVFCGKRSDTWSRFELSVPDDIGGQWLSHLIMRFNLEKVK